VEIPYKLLSTGQKLVLSIAFKLAILLEKNETGLMIADEGFSSLDIENLNHIFDLFNGLPFQLICVLHRFEDVPDGATVITLK
jgi:energy-coupling factor transporter ATP-binding protein EcfA2